jgi:adenosylhomocysteine nucleosidase
VQSYEKICNFARKKQKDMKKIGIIVAMDKELRQLQQLFPASEVLVQKCGIGKVNAALGAQRMINEFHPDCIISSGCAGGNGDDINVQDVVISTELCYHDVYCGRAIDDTTVYGQVQGLPARYAADPTLLDKALSLQPSDISLHPGLIVTGDWFVDSKDKMRDILSHFPEAKAVDMESCAIAQTCYLNHVPFISFRVISDIPLRDTDASQYHNFWDTIADHSFQVTRTFVESL